MTYDMLTPYTVAERKAFAKGAAMVEKRMRTEIAAMERDRAMMEADDDLSAVDNAIQTETFQMVQSHLVELWEMLGARNHGEALKRLNELRMENKSIKTEVDNQNKTFNRLSDQKSEVMRELRLTKKNHEEALAKMNELARMNEKREWLVGRKVNKNKGYKYPGEIVSVFRNKAQEIRYVVEATGLDYLGMLHIFNDEQLTFGE